MSDPRPGSVTAAAASSVEPWLEAFEDAWAHGPPRIDEFLPADAGLRRAVLEELIRIDINWRWSATSRGAANVPLVSLENYCQQFPELGGLAALPDGLIGEDYRAMSRWGSGPDHGSYLARFGARAGQLRKLLERIDVELAREFASAPKPANRTPTPMGLPVATPLLPLGELVKQLRALSLIESAELESLLKQPVEGGLDAHTLARALIARGSLTPYQVNLLLRGRGQELIVGQYVLLDRLGQGGMGKVFKAIHRGMRRLVALKVIHPELTLEEEVVNRFYREIRIVGQFSHRNIVHAYDAGPIGKAHALAMEYVEGTDLGRQVKRSGPIDLVRACDYVRQAAEGLQYAFERGLVHRDMKPHNLLCVHGHGERDIVKILDLGLARLQRLDNGLSSMVTPTKAAMMGTPDFLAPEQAIDFHAADTRADIYSLGCTLYYLLAGTPPFPGGSMADKLLRHQMAEPPDVRERVDVPERLADLIRRLMAKRPDDRLPTPGALAAALAPFAGPGLPAILPPISADADTVVDERTPFSGSFGTLREPLAPAAAPVPPPAAAPGLGRGVKIGLVLFTLLVLAILGTVGAVAVPRMLKKPAAVVQEPAPARNVPDALRPNEDPFFRNLLGYWRLDEGQGNHAADASGRGNHGTLHQAGWTPGIRGKGISLQGDESYLSYGTSADFNFGNNAPFTFAGWFKTGAANGMLLSQRHSERDAADIDLGLESGTLVAIVRTDSSLAGHVRLHRPVNDQRWHHFALTRSAGDTIQLFVDGMLEDRATVAGVGGAITTNLRAVGSERLWVQIRFAQQPQYRGAVDEFCIFGRELAPAEVKELMRRTGR